LEKTIGLGGEGTMKTSTTVFLGIVAVGLPVALAGCTGQSILSNEWGNSRQVPFDAVILGPNEKLTLNTLPTQESNYFCSNGAALQCERINLKLYCSCPRLP
jgi:hypothetical protein